MPRAGTAIPENWGDLLTPGLAEVFVDEYDLIPEMRTTLFETKSMNSSYAQISASGNFGKMQVFKGVRSTDEPEQLYDYTVRPVLLELSFQVFKTLLKDDLYDVIAEFPRKLADSAVETYETYSSSVLNNAFSGSGSIEVDGVTILSNTEGQALCSASHPYSPTDSTTQSNAGSTALSTTEIEAVRLKMRRFLDDRGNKRKNVGDTLIVPIDLEEEAWEIVASKGKIDTANNNANFHYGKYKLAVWDYLSDANNWFMVNSLKMKRNGLVWYDRDPMEFDKATEFDTLVKKYGITSRVGWGYGNYRFIYGENVA